jgi:DNA-directed RNA polymerase specialized sigma24 family protein
MKIPPTMTEEEVMSEITSVIDKVSHKYTFYGYEIDDIRQEAFIMCVDAMERYDPNRPLENFLSVHLSNRLKNFVRDNHFSKDEENKKRVVMPGQLSYEDSLVDERCDEGESLDYQQMSYILDLKLPSSVRSDYLKIMHDSHVSKRRKEEVLSLIKEIMEEHGHA